MSFDTDQIAFLRGIPQAVEDRQMYDLGPVVQALVVALMADGHVLLEGNPGLGKTALVRAMAGAVGLGPLAVGRIQFTPDLMPSDITGTLMPDPDNIARLRFEPGPVFCTLLLADEINRATPKTQAAMLEAMAEFQVTVLGTTRPLRPLAQVVTRAGAVPVRPPFMVMATQNPIDQDGTYDLPEAQADRFLFKIRMQLPGPATIARIIDKELRAPGLMPGADGPAPPRADHDQALLRLQGVRQALAGLALPPPVLLHVVNVVQALNRRFDGVAGVSPGRMQALQRLVAGVRLPPGPRAASALAKAALGWAAVVLTPPDEALAVPAQARAGLAATCVAVLRHRLRLDLPPGTGGDPAAEADAHDALIRALVGAAAPDRAVGEGPAGYHERFAAEAEAAAALAL